MLYCLIQNSETNQILPFGVNFGKSEKLSEANLASDLYTNQWPLFHIMIDLSFFKTFL